MMAADCDEVPHGQSITRKALLVGIGYHRETEGSRQEFGPIPTSIPNVKLFHAFIRDHCEYTDITVMTDEDGVEAGLQPTRANLEREIKKLTRGAKPGDRFIFYFSGHADQLPCKTGSEEDGMDETIVTLSGFRILDNSLHKWLVEALPEGSNLTAIFDCCNSGTMLDLPHYKCNAIYLPWVNKGKRRSDTLRNGIVRKDAGCMRAGAQSLPRPSRNSGDKFRTLTQAVQGMETAQMKETCQPYQPWLSDDPGKHQRFASPEPQPTSRCDGWCRERIKTEGSLPPAKVISISSSNDGQISYDASTRGGGSISMTTNLVGILKGNSQLTYSQLMTSLDHAVHSFTKDMHSVVRRSRRDRRKAFPKHGNYKNAEPDEGRGEMDNFQDLQLGSLTPLDMGQVFTL